MAVKECQRRDLSPRVGPLDLMMRLQKSGQSVFWAPVEGLNRGTARLLGGLFLAGSVAALGLALWLIPSSRGYGTHEQLGFPPCLCVVLFDLPCPSCGMTTAFALTVRGRWMAAARVQPAGFMLALISLALVLLSARAVATGRWHLPRWVLEAPMTAAFTLFAIIALAWAYKIVVMTGSAWHPGG